MRSYGQYCPIARASEVLAERWTPIILRNLLLGSTTFSEIAAGAPGLSRTLLTTRLRELERAGVVLHSWVSWCLVRERLPERRVVARFHYPGLPRKGAELWVVFDGERSEVCRRDPGFEVELYVEAEPRALALPTWNLRSPAAQVRRAAAS
jgi:HxlR-like helix-turn-helix